MEETYIPHSSVRLCKIDSDHWILSHLTDKKEYEVEPLITALITLFCGGETFSSFFLKAHNLINDIDKNKLIELFNYLKERNILVEKNNPESQSIKELVEKWDEYGWSAAADYYLSSISYPFIEGTVYQYNQSDSARMNSYYIDEPDLNRSKEYENHEKIISTPLASEALTDRRFKENLTLALNSPEKIVRKNTICKNDILLISSIVFGKFRSRKVNVEGIADTIRKTSPSGGSRHPTEGYIIINDEIEELDKGVYHFSVAKNALEKINSEISIEELIEIFPGLFRGPSVPKVIVILTSLFERNMYRYREPRTFRSLFVDIGHISETIRLISQALGLKYFGHTYIAFNKAEKILDINPLQEGIFYSVGIS